METRDYTFIHMPERKCKTFEDKEIKDFLMKWSMKGSLQVQYYSFNQPFCSHDKQGFFTAFFQHPAVYSTLTYNQALLPTPVKSVEFEQIPCTVLSMEFFDRLLEPENGIVRFDGKTIVQCQEEDVEGFVIDDNLRNLILNKESESYVLYSDSERKQLLWRVFCHFCLGGQWCQYEFTITPYLNAAKLLYKELISVERITDSSELVIRSVVFQVKVYGENNKLLIPESLDNTQNFVYLIVDPFKRSVAVLSHCYSGYFST